MTIPMKTEVRFRAILSLLDEKGSVTVEELTKRFDVSAETIRRDLASMSEQGLLRKIYGGAVRSQFAQESPFVLRGKQYILQKRAIADYAARFVNNGDSLFISAGTTTTIFARTLVQHRERLIIMTNSPAIAHECWNGGKGNHQVYAFGGHYNGAEYETLGTPVIDAIRQFRADHAFLTVGALNAEQGWMDYRVEVAHVNRAMAGQARRSTILLDSSKQDGIALVATCPLNAIDRLVTDSSPAASLHSVLVEADVEVHIVPSLTPYSNEETNI